MQAQERVYLHTMVGTHDTQSKNGSGIKPLTLVQPIDTHDVDLNEDAVWKKSRKLLNTLLKDHATGGNICWATDNYSLLGEQYQSDQPITEDLIIEDNQRLIQPRSKKNAALQKERTQTKAEVYTPSWVVDKQVSVVLEEFKDLPLREFVETTWMEITCGEAPYMVNRYEMDTGELIPLDERKGFIDRKFQRLNNEIDGEYHYRSWFNRVKWIYQSSYGYEYQGDSLLLARENLLTTFIDNHKYKFGRDPSREVLITIAEIISWNVFQMNGLTYMTPCGTIVDNERVFMDAVMKDWKHNLVLKVRDLGEREGE